MSVKNLTISLPDDVYREARIRAAERETSISAMVADYLRSLSDRDAEFARLEALERETLAQVTDFSASENLTRDELYDRAFRGQ